MKLKIKKLEGNFEKSRTLEDILRDKILGLNEPYSVILQALNVSKQTKWHQKSIFF